MSQEHGIEIVDLEEDNKNYKKYEKGPERMVSLNYNAREVITQKEQEFFGANGNALKWFAFVGSAHLNFLYEVPGICEIIPNVQDVLIADSGKIIEGLNVSMFIDGSSGQDMRIASILERQRREEANELKKRDHRGSSKKDSTEEGLPYLSTDEKEAGGKEGTSKTPESDLKPLSKITKVDNPSVAFAETLVLNPSQTSVTKS